MSGANGFNPPDDSLVPLRHAMWSVYLHSWAHPSNKAWVLNPELRLEPMPLPQAITVLLGEFGEHDAFRRALALRKLVAAGLNNPRISNLWGDQGPELRRAIEMLGESVGFDISRLDDLEIPESLRFLLEYLPPPQFIGGCQTLDPSCIACHNGLTLNTTVTGRVLVNKNLAEVAEIIDPRSWAKCNPYFLKAYRAQDATGYPIHVDNDATELGVPWTGLLYEQVQAGPVIFENVLEITQFTKTATRVRLVYDEKDSIRTHFPTHSINGGIEIDRGYSEAVPAGAGWTRITFEKTVRFVDLTPGPGTSIDYGELLNYWLPAILCLWVDESLGSGPCCNP